MQRLPPSPQKTYSPFLSQIEHDRNNSKAGRTWEINKCEECFTFRICLSGLALLFFFPLRDRLNKSLMPPCEHLTKATAPGLTTRTIYMVLRGRQPTEYACRLLKACPPALVRLIVPLLPSACRPPASASACSDAGPGLATRRTLQRQL